MPNVSVRIFATSGERNAGRVGPRWIFFTPSANSASGEVLAIGQKAAYFGRSRHFVNLVQGEGLYGFDGIRRTAELMMDAYLNEKDTEKLVVQKGWGCECCL